MRTNKRTFAAAEIIPRSTLEPIDCAEIFGRNAALEVDLGCGDGSFLAGLAEANPARDFVGVERLAGRVRSACRKIGHCRLTNARVLRHDILHALQQLFAPGSVDIFHLMFPDPWPKSRHQSRRIVSTSFLRAVSRALKFEGELRIATDDEDYFASIAETVNASTFAICEPQDAVEFPTSTFEQRFRANGTGIHRLVLRKVSLVK